MTFTPGIDAFARESTVFTRAFTRYGATGLSVPSIWVGGMILHKQYVTPFAPMNALHALLDRHEYRRWISMDNIVEVIMPRDAVARAARRQSRRRRLPLLPVARRAARPARPPHARTGPPAFAWSLPQDIHVAVLNRESSAPTGRGDYTGFYAPYASRIGGFDACFGGFIADLKARGLYDDSIVVLTSDHGDSLGEEGRWGHAYTIYPEVLQVPLIVHVPPALRERFQAAPDALAFTTDITPTLYTLLGHDVRPQPESPIFGRPLLWPRRHAAAASGRLSAWSRRATAASTAGSTTPASSSTSPTAWRCATTSYQLDGTPTGLSQTVTPALRAAGRKAIRQGIEAIAETYHFTPPQ